jgi:hypothetical protein
MQVFAVPFFAEKVRSRGGNAGLREKTRHHDETKLCITMYMDITARFGEPILG